MAAARSLIAEHGVAGLRVGDVTERADVAFGTFYTYFSSKAEIVEAIVEEGIRNLAETLIDLPSMNDPAERVSAGVRGIVRLAYDDPELASLLVHLERAEIRLEEMVGSPARAVVEAAIAAERLHYEDIETFLVFAMDGCFGVMRRILEQSIGADADVVCATAILQAGGLSRAEAREVASRPLPLIHTSLGRRA